MVSEHSIVDSLIKNYSNFGISRDVIAKYVREESSKYESEIDCKRQVSILLDALVVNKIYNEDLISYEKIIVNKYSYLKDSVIKKNKNLLNQILTIVNSNGLVIDAAIDMIYNNAINDIVTKNFDYDYSKLLSENILNAIKKKLIENEKIKQNSIVVNERESYDISILRKYFKCHDISYEKLSKTTGIDIQTLYQYIYLKRPIYGNELVKILVYFNVSSYDELINLVDTDENNNISKKNKSHKLLNTINTTEKCKIQNSDAPTKKDNKQLVIQDNIKVSKHLKERYDISFLREYLNENGVTQQKLADVLELNKVRLNQYLCGSRKVSKELLNEILKIFNVISYEELKKKIENDELEVPECLKSIENQRYDISFLREYLNENGVTQQKLADVFKINRHTFTQYLCGNRKISKELLNEILKVFNAISYEELKKKIENDELEVPEHLKSNEVERYDISFLREYLNENGVTQQKLADVIKINRDTFAQYLCGNAKISKELLNEILKVFNVISYEELKKKIENDELEVPECLKERYDISFLKEYLNKNGITYRKLADVLKINKSRLNQYLCGNAKISKELLNEILKVFNVISYEELKIKIDNDELEVPECLKSNEDERYDISFLKEYLNKNGVTQQKLADALEINNGTLNRYLYGNAKVSKGLFDEILKVFNVISHEELRAKVDNDELEVPEYLKKSKNKTLETIEKNNITESLSYQREEIPKMFNMINLEYLLSLMDIKNISNLDYTIVILLFGGIEKRYYSIDAISNFLQVDKSYIINIYKKCLDLYRDSFNKEIENINNLKYVNIENR